MVVDLQVIFDLRMIMALGTLHVLAKENPSYISRDGMRIPPAFQKKSLLRSGGFVPPRTLDQTSEQLI